MTLRMHNTQVVNIEKDQAQALFSRSSLASLTSYDLARQQNDGGQAIRPAGGIMR
jgi:hypothetical protein